MAPMVTVRFCCAVFALYMQHPARRLAPALAHGALVSLCHCSFLVALINMVFSRGGRGGPVSVFWASACDARCPLCERAT